MNAKKCSFSGATTMTHARVFSLRIRGLIQVIVRLYRTKPKAMAQEIYA
jgi:hypothetical protein